VAQLILDCGEAIFKCKRNAPLQAAIGDLNRRKKMSVRPLHDRVLIKRLEEETKTAGGIIIPENNKEKPSQGEVVSVGSGYRLTDGSLRELDVKAGDKVLFSKYAGTDVKVEGNDYLIMKEDEILGILQ
jgi:chaperonin GroES